MTLGSHAAETSRQRRLFHHILTVVHFACDQGDLEAAERLLAIAEFMFWRPLQEGRLERRLEARPLVAAHERLWVLRHDLRSKRTGLTDHLNRCRDMLRSTRDAMNRQMLADFAAYLETKLAALDGRETGQDDLSWDE
jgi:hypothetical protein